MQLIVFTVVGAIAFLIAYAFGLGAPVCALIFLAFVGIGIVVRASQPIIDFMRG